MSSVSVFFNDHSQMEIVQRDLKAAFQGEYLYIKTSGRLMTVEAARDHIEESVYTFLSNQGLNPIAQHTTMPPEQSCRSFG